MKKIDIEELKEMLYYDDLRAVRSWCEKNDVLIIKQGKAEFVIESNFEEVYEKPFINKLKNKFGKDWEAVYRLYKDGNVPALNVLQEANPKNHQTYQPKNNIIQNYLSKYQSHGKKKLSSLST